MSKTRTESGDVRRRFEALKRQQEQAATDTVKAQEQFQ